MNDTPSKTGTSAEAVERITIALHSARQTHSSVRVDPKDLEAIISAFEAKADRIRELEAQVGRVTVSEAARERVARAIANAREGGWPADTYAMLQQHYLTMADAALRAIQEQNDDAL